MKKIQYMLTKVSGALGGSQPKFQAHVQSKGVIPDTTFAASVAKDSNRSSEDVEFIMKSALKNAREFLRQGYDVRIGDVKLRGIILGPFPTKDAQFDRDRNALVAIAQTMNGMRNCFPAGTQTENLVVKPIPVIHSCGDRAHGEPWTLYTGGTVYMQGKNIATDVAQPGEGITLLDPETKEVVATATITQSDDQLIDFTFAEWPQPGEYILSLATRCGFDTDYSLSTVTKVVTVKAAS